MDDDFNTSAALANLYSIFKYANASMKGAKKSNRKATANTMAKILEELHKAYTVLGLFEQDPETFVVELKKKYLKKIEVDEDYINEQIKKRAEAKKLKNFELADSIRDILNDKGIILNDSREGTTWDVKALYKIGG